MVAVTVLDSTFGVTESSQVTSGDYFESDNDQPTAGAPAQRPASHGLHSSALGGGGRVRNLSSLLQQLNISSSSTSSTAFAAFGHYAMKEGVCIEATKTVDGSIVLISLPPYEGFKPSQGKPCLVKVVTYDADMFVLCSCPSSRRSAISGACWHEELLRVPGILETFTDVAHVLCDNASGRPSSDVVCVLSTKRRQGTTDQVPFRVSVFVRTADNAGEPGNVRPAILTFRRLHSWLGSPDAGRAYSMTCDSCQSGSKAESTVANKAVCKHLLATRAAMQRDPEKYQPLRALLEHNPGVKEKARVFDTAFQTWCFPSHDEAISKSRASSRVPVSPPSQNRRSSPAALGGPGDPRQRRLLVFVDILRGVDALYSLFVHRITALPSPHCSSGSQPPCEYFVAQGSSGVICCVVCGRGVVCSMCKCGKSSLCFECLRAEAESGASAGQDFAASFPEFAHLIPKGSSGTPIAPFVRMVIELAHDQPDLRLLAPRLQLKPPMPPPLPPRDVAATGDACTYDESGYFEVGSSTVYGFSHAEHATVYGLCCSKGPVAHPGCVLEFCGADMWCHRQTKETIFRVEVFDFFWLCQRTMRGASAKSFVHLVREVYARCGSLIAFSSEWLFRDAFFAFFSSFKANFNRPCITCPVLRDRETGAVFTGCTVLGLDAISLLSRSDPGETYRFDQPTAKSTSVDCRSEHIYDRLFFPGKVASVVGKLRLEAEVLCRRILRKPPPPGKLTEVDFGSLAGRFASIPQLEGFSSAIGVVCDAIVGSGLGQPVTNLARSIADIILCMCNPQGEVLQISNLEDAQFIATVLEKDGSGTLTSVFLEKSKISSNIRGSIAELARAGLEASPSGVVRLNSVVKTMLCAIMKTTQRALRQSKLGPDLPPIPPGERELNDPSVTLLALNFTQGGARLRLPPRFREMRKDKREDGCIKKQWELQNKHKKRMGHTRGVLNVVCIRSQQSLGFLTLRDYEGRSHGPMAIYSYMPNYPRFIICDTGCQSASWCHTHLSRYFRRWRFLVDRFHHFPHKCQRVTQGLEFSIMRGKNDSFVEQLHAVQRALGLTMINTGQVRAVFLLQLLNYHLYCDLAEKAGVPEENRCWPENTDSVPWAPIPNDDSDSDDAADCDAEQQRASDSDDNADFGEEEEHVPDDDTDGRGVEEDDEGADEGGEDLPADNDMIQDDDDLEDFEDA
jgi:hypothetical protein